MADDPENVNRNGVPNQMVYDLSSINFGTNFAQPDMDKVPSMEPSPQQEMFQYDLDAKMARASHNPEMETYNPPDIFGGAVTLATAQDDEESNMMQISNTQRTSEFDLGDDSIKLNDYSNSNNPTAAQQPVIP